MRVAFVNDNKSFAISRIKSLQKTLPKAEFAYFETGNELLERMKAGERFDAYLLDLVPKEESINGYQCTKGILAIDPKAVVIGHSACRHDPDDEAICQTGFQQCGAKDFVAVEAGPEAMVKVLQKATEKNPS